MHCAGWCVYTNLISTLKMLLLVCTVGKLDFFPLVEMVTVIYNKLLVIILKVLDFCNEIEMLLMLL